jgi:hypothetical protein
MLANKLCVEWISGLSQTAYVVVCVGGGTQINEEFAQRGFPVTEHGPLGRETETFEQRQIARDILEKNAAALEDLLSAKGIHVRVEIPVLNFGGVLCHVNGDLMVRAVYLGYDEVIILTTPDRYDEKRAAFAELPKVHVFCFY